MVWCGVGVKADCLKKGPRPIGVMPSVGVFQRDSSPYLREFRRKPRKTPNGLVDMRDRGMDPAPPVYQFRT